MFPRFRKPNTAETAAASLLESVRSAAREPGLFGPGRVPDTLDGRFESMVLHVVLLLERLRADGEGAGEVAQALFDALFKDLDAAVRELGSEDLGVAKRVRRMAEAFYGRQAAYSEALAAADDAPLRAALERNLLATTEASPAFLATATAYVRATVRQLAAQPVSAILSGKSPHWPPPPR